MGLMRFAEGMRIFESCFWVRIAWVVYALVNVCGSASGILLEAFCIDFMNCWNGCGGVIPFNDEGAVSLFMLDAVLLDFDALTLREKL